MSTTADYLTQLASDKADLVDNLVTKGVEASDSETFTTLVPKVLNIPSGGGGSFNAYKVASMSDPILANSQNGEFATLYDSSTGDFAFKQHVKSSSQEVLPLDPDNPPQDITTVKVGEYYVHAMTGLPGCSYDLYTGSNNEIISIKVVEDTPSYGEYILYIVIVDSSGTTKQYIWNGMDTGMADIEFTFDDNASSGNPGDQITFTTPININTNIDWSDVSSNLFGLLQDVLSYLEIVHIDRWDNVNVFPWATMAYQYDIMQGKKAYTNYGIVTGSYVPPVVQTNTITMVDNDWTTLPNNVPEGTLAIGPLYECDGSTSQGGASPLIFLPKVTLYGQISSEYETISGQSGEEDAEIIWTADSTNATIEIKEVNGAMMTIALLEYTSEDGQTYTLDSCDIPKLADLYPILMPDDFYRNDFDVATTSGNLEQFFCVEASGYIQQYVFLNNEWQGLN